MAQIILASGSKIRADMLTNAGVDFVTRKSAVDEDATKARCREKGHDIGDIARQLAVEKAMAVSRSNLGSWVIGADQMLGLGSRSFDKPGTMAEAAQRLKGLSGKTHILYCAACVVRDGNVMWQALARPELTMRTLSEDDISTYLADAGEDILSSVGAYQLEGLGARLFRAVEGDYFSILGLPLLSLLAFLREQKLVAY